MGDVNLIAVLAATAGQFAFGAVWYTFIFGKLWGKIHGFDNLSKAKQQELMSQMGPIYGVQFLVTILGSIGLAKLIVLLPEYSPYSIAVWVWMGFAVPAHVADVLFGGTDSKWIVKKIAVTTGATLGYLLVAAFILGLF